MEQIETDASRASMHPIAMASGAAKPYYSDERVTICRDGHRLQICTVCNQIGTVGRCCGRDTHRDLEESDLRNGRGG